jgi:hypothetical protein
VVNAKQASSVLLAVSLPTGLNVVKESIVLKALVPFLIPQNLDIMLSMVTQNKLQRHYLVQLDRIALRGLQFFAQVELTEKLKVFPLQSALAYVSLVITAH